MPPDSQITAPQLFDELVDLPPPQRRQQLDDLQLDPDTRSEVESLLAAHDDAGEFFSEKKPVRSEVDPYKPGVWIGAYELVELLGEGGFARVFRARQTRPVRREVAVKIIKLGMDTPAVIARFDQERQALAMMDHPSIAAVYDAGATETGRPYFVMELVRGQRITRHCDENSRSIRQRVELFIDVCRAVQHAHEKGVLHRDLKPSNILVTMHGDRPTPKVIDFGIAKAMQQRLTDLTLVTQQQQMLGTPQYMSPEQALSGGTDVDTRSDIYSLGAVLYELLAGVPPLEESAQGSSALEQLQKLTSDRDIPPPSTRAATDRRRALHGEMDWIVGKCLEKDRSRRYDSAAALAADLEAHLHDRPITAAPPSPAYRAKKFIRRNAIAVVAAAVVLISLLMGSIVSTTQAIRATRAERLAQKRLEDAESANTSLRAVNEFLTQDMIGSAEPAVTQGRELTVREALDNAAKALPGKFPDRPATEAAVHNSVAMAYLMLGHAELSLPHADEALEQRRAALGPDHPDTIVAMNNRALVLKSLGRLSEAEPLFRQALETCRRVLHEDHDHTLSVLNNYAQLLTALGRWTEAEALLRQVWDQSRRVRGDDHEKTTLAVLNYAQTVRNLGRMDESLKLCQQEWERSRRVRGENHPLTLTCCMEYAGALDSLGRHAESQPLYQSVLEGRRRVLGENHPDTIAAQSGYGSVLWSLGRYADAQPILKDALERRRRVLGDDHPSTVATLSNYADLLLTLGRTSEAEPLHREALQRHRRVLGEDHPETLSSMNKYAYTLRSLGRTAEAEPMLKQVLERRRQTLGEDHPDTILSLNNYASFLQFVGRATEAEPLHKEALDRRRRVLGDDHRLTVSSYNNYANVLRVLGRPAEAEPFARLAWEKYHQSLGVDHPDTILVLSNYAATVSALGRHADAEPLYAEMYQSAARAQIPPARAAQYMAAYGPCLVRLAKYDQAEAPLHEAYRRLRETDQSNHPTMRIVLESLAKTCDHTNRPADAQRWRAELAALPPPAAPATHPTTATAERAK